MAGGMSLVAAVIVHSDRIVEPYRYGTFTPRRRTVGGKVLCGPDGVVWP